MADEEVISIDDIKLWTVERLKKYLKERNLKVSGRKDELVALVFAAKSWPHLLPSVSRTAAESKSQKYEELLELGCDGTIPDPKSLTGWISQTDSLPLWPPTMAFDIGEYLRSIDNIPLRNRLMSDYKEGKGYSYFESKHVKSVEYHPISDTHNVCIMRADCMPSQRLHSVPWKVWVAINKKSGKIRSAYCTCFAGFSGTCNHVAGILFKIDFAWRHGLTNPACTDKECGWGAFGGKHSLEPKRVSEMSWKKPKFSKQASRVDDAWANPLVRQLFSPVESRASGSGQKRSLKTLSEALISGFEDAACFQYVECGKETCTNPVDDINVHFESEVVATEIPPALPIMGENATTLEQFLDDFPTFSSRTVRDLEAATREQSGSKIWRDQRQGRVTSSVAHQVMTRGTRILQGSAKAINNAPLVKQVMGYTAPKEDIPSLKYGREMEEEARSAYIKEMKKGKHANFKVGACGLRVKSDQMYIGASADGTVSCSCCGEGLLEIKCPYSLSGLKPTVENLPYLTEENP